MFKYVQSNIVLTKASTQLRQVMNAVAAAAGKNTGV